MNLQQRLLSEAAQALPRFEQESILVRYLKNRNRTGNISPEALEILNVLNQKRALNTELSQPLFSSGTTQSDSRFATLTVITKLHEQVLGSLLQNGTFSRNDIAADTGLRLQSCCGRVNELIAMGFIEVMGVAKDARSNRSVELLSLTVAGYDAAKPRTSDEK